jgi:hypothetical protein
MYSSATKQELIDKITNIPADPLETRYIYYTGTTYEWNLDLLQRMKRRELIFLYLRVR